MKVQTWNHSMSVEQTKDLAYWERNMLALYYADGWYDDLENGVPRFEGWRRALSLEGGRMTFHIPDDFAVGDLSKIEPNWDGHTTAEKWGRVLDSRGIAP